VHVSERTVKLAPSVDSVEEPEATQLAQKKERVSDTGRRRSSSKRSRTAEK